ncbi:MAG: alpha-galactosidase [Candidatus Omnitrophota bacterium]
MMKLRLMAICQILLFLALSHPSLAKNDWLIQPAKESAKADIHSKSNEIVLKNGLIQRTFKTSPNFATVDFYNNRTGVSLLRGVKPEAAIQIGGEHYEIGGLKGQPDYGYLDPAWLTDMTSNPDAFQFTGCRVESPQARYEWKPKRPSSHLPWPPKGATLIADFTPPEKLKDKYAGLTVSLYYEMYDGIPTMSKWAVIKNESDREIVIDALDVEILAVTEQEKTHLYADDDYKRSVAGESGASVSTVSWGPDLEYTSQIDYLYQMPLLLTCRYPLGPGAHLAPGETFESFRVIETVFDSDDLERQGLAVRRTMRTLAPQVTENPILMHVRNSDPETVRNAIDQCAETGFEMVIMTFWSGFNIESEDPQYIASIKALVDYAHSKDIELGGYTLMCASRDAGEKYNCIDPKTDKPGSRFGQSACLASEWADGYFQRVLHFIDATGLDVIETDGPYHGDVCASTLHKHHKSLEDSQWTQWKACCNFYFECRKRGVYVNTPDWYYLNGSNKCAMGYRETNFSLPRWRQILLARQNIFDGTYLKTPSMGWMFVPLVEYHGGGAAATMEPLSEHLQEFEWHLAQNFGTGVQACYRGPRLYDTDETKAVVKKWVDFYKRHREILDSDIIHVRRADGKTIDCMMGVNPHLEGKGLAMVFNPTNRKVETTLELPLYYTGLEDTASISEKDDIGKTYKLDRDYTVQIPVTLGPKGITWFVIR